MYLSQRLLNSPLLYTTFCSPYNLQIIGVFKVREYMCICMILVKHVHLLLSLQTQVILLHLIPLFKLNNVYSQPKPTLNMAFQSYPS